MDPNPSSYNEQPRFKCGTDTQAEMPTFTQQAPAQQKCNSQARHKCNSQSPQIHFPGPQTLSCSLSLNRKSQVKLGTAGPRGTRGGPTGRAAPLSRNGNAKPGIKVPIFTNFSSYMTFSFIFDHSHKKVSARQSTSNCPVHYHLTYNPSQPVCCRNVYHHPGLG